VPADFQLQEYYRIKNEEPFLSTPPSSYPTYEDDHICYSFKLPEDPFVLELGIDYFGSNSTNGFKDATPDFAEKESGRSAGVVSPQAEDDKSLFKPINDDSPIHTGSRPKRTSPEPSSCLTPTKETYRLRVPPLYPTNRREKFSLEIHSPFPDDDYFLMDNLPLVGQTYAHANKVPFKSHTCPEYATPFFSVSRRFEEDLCSLLNLNSAYLPELAEDDRNQKSSSDYDDDCVDQHQHFIMESIKTSNNNQINNNNSSSSNNENNTNNQNNNNNNNNSNSNNYNNNSSNTMAINEVPYTESYPISIPSEYMTVQHTHNQSHTLPSPATCRYSTYESESDPADYSLLDDGDDGDILCFLGYQTLTSRWNTEESEAGVGVGSVCEQQTDSERD
jgi:hypothetical protein